MNWAQLGTPLLLVLLIIAVAVAHATQKHKAERVTEWFLSAVESGDAQAAADFFCEDGILLGTVSQIERRGADIRKYFDYFANLPNLRVVERTHEISELEPDVYVDNAVVTWAWDEHEPLTARMSFGVKNGCIFELHSSELPHESEKLHEASGKW